jgi:hypothetical protein
VNDGAASIKELEAAFAACGYTFCHFPDARFSALRWQAGRNVTEIVDLPDGKSMIVERFELLAWASTSGELIDQLARLPAPAVSQWPFEVA